MLGVKHVAELVVLDDTLLFYAKVYSLSFSANHFL